MVYIILEGPDGAGKSTLAKELVSKLSYRQNPTVYQHLHNHSDFHEYDWPKSWLAQGMNVVQDRSLLSALVYDPILRGPGNYKWPESLVRNSLGFVSQNALIVYLTADKKDLLARMDRTDDLIKDEYMDKILRGYEREIQHWKQSDNPIICTFDTSNNTFPTVDEVLLALSVEKERRK